LLSKFWLSAPISTVSPCGRSLCYPNIAACSISELMMAVLK
jgi:hypothetical protein